MPDFPGSACPQIRSKRNYAGCINNPLEENIGKTAEAVELCKAVGVPVEGELGHVGTTNDEVMGSFTEVHEAVRFVEETGVSALAIMVGTAHGRYKKAPQLNIKRIAEIREKPAFHLCFTEDREFPTNR